MGPPINVRAGVFLCAPLDFIPPKRQKQFTTLPNGVQLCDPERELGEREAVIVVCPTATYT